jgi:predicted alpha/beta-hydrolase family hydrolase
VGIATLVPESWDGDVAIILAHGAGQGMDSPFMNFFHTELANTGCISVKFNFDYMEGKRRVPDPQPKLQARFRAVIEEVVSKHHARYIIIGGKSMGGRVASYIAGETAGVSGLLFLGYPLHPPGKPDQLRDEHLYRLHLPMLFVSGTKDPFVGVDLLEGVGGRIGRNATLVWIENGDHSLNTRRKSQDSWRTAIDAVRTWIENARLLFRNA